MKNKSKAVSYTLAALAGVFFATGIALLSDEVDSANNGTCEETIFNDLAFG